MAKTNERNIWMIKAVIFDMDGTVVETTTHDFAVWQKIFGENGKELSFETFKRFLGKASKEILKEHFPHLSEKRIAEAAKKKDDLFSNSLARKGITTTPGLTDFIKLLKKYGYKLALATGGSRGKVNILKKYVPFDDYFSIIVTTSEVAKGKPYPDIFLKAADELDVNPEDCIVVEDANNGIKAAKNAGMKCIAITTTHTKEELKNADKIIHSFDDLTIEAIKHLEGDKATTLAPSR